MQPDQGHDADDAGITAPTEVPAVRAVRPTTDEEPPPSIPPAPSETAGSSEADTAPPQPPPDADQDSVFLKQNGQIYMVRDWETLQRWIVERRVDRHDLVSEGGVRWEPIGSRPDLMPLFAGAPPAPEKPSSTPFPFGGETPFGAGSSPESGWHDDDTEGVPVGLPPLPTEDVADGPSPDLVWDPKSTPPPPAMLETPMPVDPRAEALPIPALAADEPPLEDEDSDIVSGPEEDETERIQAVPPPPVAVPSPSGPSAQPTNESGSWDDLLAEEPDEQPSISSVTTPVSQSSDPSAPSGGSSAYPPMDDMTFEEEWANAYGVPGRRGAGVIWGAAAVGTLVVLLVLGWAWWSQREPVAVVPPAPEPVPATTAPLPEPAAPEAPSPDPAPAEPAPATPAPAAPVPTPSIPVVAPAPPTPPPAPAPAPSGADALVGKAWKSAESNPAGAAEMFREALALEPGHWDGQYGLGYVLLKLGELEAATPYLCRCREAPDAEIRQDATGMLAARGMTCG